MTGLLIMLKKIICISKTRKRIFYIWKTILKNILKSVHRGGIILCCIWVITERGVFKTEQECLEYEQKLEQERVKKKKVGDGSSK